MREQRLTNRFPVQRTVLCKARSCNAMAEVLDMSLTGVRVRGSAKLETGSTATLKVLGCCGSEHKEVNCQVQWQRPTEDGRYETGFCFMAPIPVLVKSWVGEILGELENTNVQLLQRRKSIRTAVRIPLTVEEEDGGALYGEFVELSGGGAILRTSRRYAPGETVRVRANLAGRVVTLESTVIRFVEGARMHDHSLRFENLDEVSSAYVSRAVNLALPRTEMAAA